MRQSTGSRGMKRPSSRHFPPPLILLPLFHSSVTFESKMMKGLYVFRGCDSHSSSNTVCIEYAVNDYRNRYNKQER